MVDIGRIGGMKPIFPADRPSDNVRELALHLKNHIDSFASTIREVQQNPAHLRDRAFLKHCADSITALNGIIDQINQTLS